MTGREIKRTLISDEAFRNHKLSQGIPAERAEMLVNVFHDARQGYFAATDPTLGELLDRRPRTMHDVLVGILKPE